MPYLLNTAFEESKNAYQSTIIALGSDHFWAMSEETGDFVDAVGNWDFTVDTNNVQRGIVGAIRGEPRKPAYLQDPGATGLTHSASLSERLTGTVGAIGGFIGMGVAANNTERFTLLSAEYNSNPNAGWTLDFDTVGRVRMRLANGVSTITDFIAEWVWDTPAVRNAFKTSDGDNRVSGDKIVFLCVVQRADGNGPLLSVNGATPIAATTTTFGLTGDNDSWMNELDTDVGSVTSYEVKTKDDSLLLQGVFVFDGAAPSNAEIADIHAAANTDGDVTDYCEYVKAVGPIFWMAPSSGGLTGTANMAWWVKNFSNVSDLTDLNPLVNRYNWRQDSLSREVDWPTSLSGMDYFKKGISIPGGSTAVGLENRDQEFSDAWITARNCNTGTLCIIFKWPTTTSLQFLFGARTVTGNYQLYVRTVSDFLQFYSQRGSFSNSLTINLERPVSVGDVCMVCYRQTGTQIDTFVNGVLRDGGDIGTTITGTATGSDWFHTLREVSGRWNWTIGGQPPGVTANKFTDEIYDVWIKRDTPLSSAQVKTLWDLVSGSITQTPEPTFL